ncbi:MAG: hypothetical protein HY360_08230 [Verrucomicrobia bacterium]|nr:hypothetical protein [Verrucomicrobiota bacterium]
MTATQLNSWERVKLAIDHHQTDRVPTNFVAVPEVADRLIGEMNLANYDQLLDCLGSDVRDIEARYIGPPDRTGGFGVSNAQRDVWGVIRKPVTNQFSTYNEIVHYPLGEVKTVDEVENYAWPKIEWFDFSHLPDQIRQWDRRQKPWIKCSTGGAFESAWYLRGLEKFLMDLVDRPEFAEAIMRHVAGFWIAYALKAYEACDGRLDMFETGGDLGTQSGMLLSPDLWRRHIKPHSGGLIGTQAQWGAQTFYHSCGAIRPVIPDLIEMGVNVLDPIQPRARGMDPVSLKAEFGDKIAFHGGIDEQELLPHASSKEVFEHTQRMIAAMSKGGGYILAPSHAIQGDTPTSNILAMYRAAGAVKD